MRRRPKLSKGRPPPPGSQARSLAALLSLRAVMWGYELERANRIASRERPRERDNYTGIKGLADSIGYVGVLAYTFIPGVSLIHSIGSTLYDAVWEEQTMAVVEVEKEEENKEEEATATSTTRDGTELAEVSSTRGAAVELTAEAAAEAPVEKEQV